MPATRKLAPFLKPYWLWATLAPLLMVLEVAMDLMQPRLIQHMIDAGILQQDMRVVLVTGAWMLGLAVVGFLGGIGCAVFAVMAGQAFGADLRSALFRQVQTLAFGNLDELETGSIVTRLTNDVIQVQELVMMMLRVMVRAPMLLVGSLVMAVLTSPQLALLFVVLIPVVLVFVVWIVNKTFPLFSTVQQKLDAINTVMQENLAGVRVVKAFSRRDYEIDRFAAANDAWMAHNLKAVRVSALTMPFMMLVLNLGIVATLWFGGVQVTQGSLQVGQIVAFVNYLMITLMSLMMVSMLVMRVARAEASAVRIVEVLESTPRITPHPEAVTDFKPAGRVAFEDVVFRYGGAEQDAVLRGINFVAAPGETVAVLGATGAGKSSLVNLIPRFYDVSEGRVTIDGVDVRTLDEAALRRQIGVALQESVLFSGTVRDNIRYGRPDASDAEVVAAAKLAQAHEFITAFPDGYDTVVGQRGVNLSGGQKQRIAIARALLHDPALLILDDSTSAVDVDTEARIQEELARINGARTTFVVAQRISTVLSADQILVLDDGRIVAAGTHAELLRTSPIYGEIYASQMDTAAAAAATTGDATEADARTNGATNGARHG
ncbi:MAG: ABC transporter ATP-binding protein [Caldilineaceae bacterium]|nr:ABC transporter ATP-binding protein [Caldilineaceae bacterium]